MRVIIAAAALTIAAVACGGGTDDSAATPAPTLVQNPQSGILKPADKARDTANDVEQRLNQEDQQTGSGY